MRALMLAGAAAALVLVTGAAARASELMTLRKGAMVTSSEWQLDEACEMLDDNEAMMDLLHRDLIMFTGKDVQVYVQDAISSNNAKVRVKGTTRYFYVRRYNLQEGVQ